MCSFFLLPQCCLSQKTSFRADVLITSHWSPHYTKLFVSTCSCVSCTNGQVGWDCSYAAPRPAIEHNQLNVKRTFQTWPQTLHLTTNRWGGQLDNRGYSTEGAWLIPGMSQLMGQLMLAVEQSIEQEGQTPKSGNKVVSVYVRPCLHKHSSAALSC